MSGPAYSSKTYLVFAESAGARGPCGIALSQRSGEVSYSFLLGPSCNVYPAVGANAVWPFGASYLSLHELFHSLDAVPGCAPNEGNGAHATDSAFDVMFLGGRTPEQWAISPSGGLGDDVVHGNRGNCSTAGLVPTESGALSRK